MRTYTCFIVDDEDLIVQRLELFFQELAGVDLRFRLVGKAYGGITGAEEALQLKPDIVISDIVMPKLDGITMIERLKPALPNTQFILLTAYSSFEYAQRAIGVSVLDYIVKVPLKEEAVRRALDKAAGVLDEIRSKDEEIHSLHASVLENKHRVRKQLFGELIRGEIPSRLAPDFANRQQVRFFDQFYCCFIVEMNHYGSFRSEYSAADQSILKYAMTNVIEETVMNFGTGAASDLYDNRFIGFISWEKSRSDMDTEQACQTLGRQLVSHLSRYLNQPVSVAFGGPHRGWESIRQSYGEAVAACDDFYYLEDHAVQTALHRFRYNHDGKAELQRKLEELTRRVDGETAKDELEKQLVSLQRFITDNKIHKSVMAPLLRDFCRDIAMKLKAGTDQPDAEQFPLQFVTVREQLRYIRDLAIACSQDGSSHYRTEIIRAKRFIEQNLKQRLTLQAIAEHVNLAPSYFSSLFKKTMNEGVVDYINRRKIELALELLKVRDYSNLELCEEVGVVNEGYFCKLFRQYTETTPKQYRKKLYGNK
ncbi:AraC family transcriptional regulator [Paenibacillus sp. HJGM_3]|uniref:AraC family transcriptional regulator n=1 Tax=Paenibacillus sp. HJGM_3 TaxID=3379816 RepID=UPI00385FFEFB